MKYQSEQLAVIHESAKDLYELGIISEERMREFDKGCLVPEPSARGPTASIHKHILTAKTRN